MVNERLKVCSELWAAGVKVETSYADNPKVQRMLEFTLENGIPLIMWLGENEIKEGVVKVKNMNKHEEYIIKREEMVERVRQLVLENPALLPQDQ
jgi:histidyl-tRNA synthetase